jgi:PAS domain S-box-containing protein
MAHHSFSETAGPDWASGILAASPDCVIVTCPEGVVRYINSQGVKLFEFESENAALGSSIANVWPLTERPRIYGALSGAAAGEITRIEGICQTAKGTTLWCETRFAPFKQPGSTSLLIIATCRDLSRQPSLEPGPTSGSNRFALLVESAGEGILEMAPDGSCNFMNAAGAAMLGYAPGEITGRQIHSLIHHHDPSGLPLSVAQCQIAQAMQAGKTVRVENEVFWRKDGSAVPVSYSVNPILVKGDNSGAVVTFSDMTDRRRVENDLRTLAARLSEQDRRKSEFIATLAHELRNPLAPLRNGLQIIVRADEDRLAVTRAGQMMERQLAHMVHLINDLLELARITSGKVELKNKHLVLGRIVESAVESSLPNIEARRHRLVIGAIDESLVIDADPTRIVQVLTNLLNNAAKYTPPEGQIDLAVRRAGSEVEIVVTDNGVGISAESLSAVFDMFSQVGRGLDRTQGGLGIGLNLARRLIDLHGGTLTAVSRGIGKGSSFIVRLPLAAPTTAPAAAETHYPSARPSTKPLKVLVVDDNADAAESFSVLLEMGGHICRIAHDGFAALRIAQEFQPAVVFLDIGMPGMNGYEVARALLKIPGMERAALVALTGWGSQDDRDRSLEAGIHTHLIKPAGIGAVDKLLSSISVSARPDGDNAPKS